MLFVQFLLFLKVTSAFALPFNISEYYHMPKLNVFDDYDECMGTYGDKALYCLVDTYIRPDHGSELYKFIVDFSKNPKQRFRHDNLVRGLCVNKCREIVEKLGSNKSEYFVEKFPIDTKMIYESINYFNSKHDRVEYAELLNECVNVELREKFGLSGFSAIEYCVNDIERPPIDSLDKFAAYLVLALFTLLVASSVFDRILRNVCASKGLNGASHYQTPLKTKALQLLTIFSVRRNWNILSAPEKGETQLIQAMRVLTMWLIIFGHVSIFTGFLPISTTIISELKYLSIPNFIVTNGNDITQTFFVISGFLCAYLFQSRVQNQVSSVGLFLKAFVIRYLRLAPLQAMAILLHSTWLYRIGYGPIFNKIVYAEQQFCRQHWWKNMLFIANYSNVSEICLIHTWYMSCEFWLSAGGILFMLVVKKYPELKYRLLSIVLGAAAFLLGATVYIKKLEPIPIFPPEVSKNHLASPSARILNYFEILYTPTHLNIGNYFIGIGVGLIYFSYKQQNKVFEKTFLRRVLWYISVIALFVKFCSGYIFYNNDFEKHSLWIAFAAIVSKHIWGVAIGYFMFSTIFRFGWFIPNIFNHPVWNVLGKLSFTAYVFHQLIVNYLILDVYQPIRPNRMTLFALGISATALSLLLGLFFSLTIELPVSSILKMILSKSDENTGRSKPAAEDQMDHIKQT